MFCIYQVSREVRVERIEIANMGREVSVTDRMDRMG